MEVNEHFERLSLTYPYLGLGVQDDLGAFPKYDIGADRMKNEQERRIFPLESAHSR
uniref:Uncharacterized protein n=2 Tax=Candidatus Kentrum sp. FM TaxID=2126340 RepID=A0A450U3R7_9GAMM|nr:MAG: hypothetical protein BECKFM1743A_GA0114220_110351 [Candidatus Kentron sp. FM]